MSPDDIEYLVSLYDSEVAFTDYSIGGLIDELKRSGLYENSLIILTADHGEEFMERNWIGHSVTLHQELVHVPLIIKMPHGRPDIIESYTGLIDIMPTILDFLGLDIPAGLEGTPLDLSQCSIPVERPIFSETFNPQVHQEGPIEPIAFRSVVLGSNKLIYDERKGTTKVYDLKEDPREKNNLSARDRRLTARLESILQEWRERVGKKGRDSSRREDTELFTEEQLKYLKSLGYL